VSGDELEVVTEAEIAPLAPGESADVQIALQAPAEYAAYTSRWQLQDGQGTPIGEELEIACRVGPTPTPRPTATPTPTPTPLFTPTPMEQLRIDSVGVVPGTFQVLEGGQWQADIYVVARGGDGKYRFYRDIISTGSEFFPLGDPWVGVERDVRWKVCEAMQLSFWVTSAGMQAHWAGAVPYPNATCP
jgi:hypothetical protein